MAQFTDHARLQSWACGSAIMFCMLTGCINQTKHESHEPDSLAIFNRSRGLRLNYEYNLDVAYKASDEHRATLFRIVQKSGHLAAGGTVEIVEVVNCEERLRTDEATSRFRYLVFLVLDLNIPDGGMIATIRRECPWVVVLPSDSKKLAPIFDQLMSSKPIGAYPTDELNWVTAKQNHRVSSVIASKWAKHTTQHYVIENIAHQIDYFHSQGRWIETGARDFYELAQLCTNGSLGDLLTIDQFEAVDDFSAVVDRPEGDNDKNADGKGDRSNFGQSKKEELDLSAFSPCPLFLPRELKAFI